MPAVASEALAFEERECVTARGGCVSPTLSERETAAAAGTGGGAPARQMKAERSGGGGQAFEPAGRQVRLG